MFKVSGIKYEGAKVASRPSNIWRNVGNLNSNFILCAFKYKAYLFSNSKELNIKVKCTYWCSSVSLQY